MQKNAYYQQLFARPNLIKRLILNIFLGLSYYFRVPIEVVIRKSFGERYFSLLLSVIIAIALVVTPYMLTSARYGSPDIGFMLKTFGTWYIYTCYFSYCVYQRWQEVKREPSVFDFAKFSLSTGRFHPIFSSNANGKKFNSRVIETVLEPGIFLVAGAILSYFGQPLGALFVICAIVYSLGYVAAYQLGDDFIMDKIDEIICNTQLTNTFVNDEQSEVGIPIYGRRPTSAEMREQLANSFKTGKAEEEEVTMAV